MALTFVKPMIRKMTHLRSTMAWQMWEFVYESVAPNSVGYFLMNIESSESMISDFRIDTESSELFDVIVNEIPSETIGNHTALIK